MKFTEWIKKRMSGCIKEPDYRELREIAKKAGLLAGVYDHGELAKLIRQYGHSDKTIENIVLSIAKSEPFDAPGSTGKHDTVEMMEALNATGFMKKYSSGLSDIVPEDADMVHGMLAMHTFMCDAYQKQFPGIGREPVPPEEVDAAMRILDCRRKNRDVMELCELASYGMMPSAYVKLRYDIEDKCSTYEWLESYLTDRDDCCIEHDVRMNAPRIEAEMCAAAEKAVENIPGVRLPDFYLEDLDNELGKLGRITVSPECIKDLILGCDSVFLAKYGIDRTATSEEQSRQAQQAYKKLDDRLVKVTGRRPYADKLLDSLQRTAGNSAGNDRMVPSHQHHISNPPASRTKGRKHSI